MKILAIETSTLLGSVAVVEDESLLCELTLQVKETHSSQLLPAITHVLNMAQLNPDDLDGFAVAAGPGSFTGLRIGMAAIKGLAVAARKPLVGVSTLEAMAWTFPFSSHLLCPMLDARMKEVYGAWFRAEEGTIVRLSEDTVLPPREFVRDAKEPAICFGSGALRYREEIVEGMGKLALFPVEKIMGARASAVGLLASRRLKKNDTDDVNSIEPLYIRQAQALESRRRRQTKS